MMRVGCLHQGGSATGLAEGFVQAFFRSTPSTPLWVAQHGKRAVERERHGHAEDHSHSGIMQAGGIVDCMVVGSTEEDGQRFCT